MKTICLAAILSIITSNAPLHQEMKILKRDIDYNHELKYALDFCVCDKNLVLAIMKVESDFVTDAVNHSAQDYGLMQINKWHVNRLALNRKKLLTNVFYNVNVGCSILNWFTSRYDMEEAIARYNGGTAKNIVKKKSVKRYVKKVMYWKNKLDKGVK